MKKLVTIMFIIIILMITVPYIFVEVQTVMNGKTFEKEYKQTGKIKDISFYRVYYCLGDTAKVYYIDKDGTSGNFVWFKKDSDGKWVLNEWKIVWTTYSGVDSIYYPYYR